MRPIVVSSWCFLPQIVKLDQFGLVTTNINIKTSLYKTTYSISVRQQILPYTKEIFAELPQTFHEPLRFFLAPFFVYSFGDWTFDQRLQGSSRIVTRIVKLCTPKVLQKHVNSVQSEEIYHVQSVNGRIISGGRVSPIFWTTAVTHPGKRCHAASCSEIH